jgi:hypothetical protein
VVDILVSRRSTEERKKNHIIAINKKIQQYIKNGSKSDLDLHNLPIKSLPDNLTIVGKNLMLTNTEITKLPNDLKIIYGDLDLRSVPITSLSNLKIVYGNVRADYSRMTMLPNGLEVKGDLILYQTPITHLPNNLIVYGNLSLSATLIVFLPDDIIVLGELYLYNTPISRNKELLEYYKTKYKIYA